MTEKFLIVDTEGSGLFDYSRPADVPGQPRLCAICMIRTDADFNVESEAYQLIKPEGWILDDASEAARINGLTHAQLLAEGIPVSDVLADYERAITDEHRIFVAHNVSHDLKVMRAELRHAGRDDMYMKTRSCCTMWGCRDICCIQTGRGRGNKIPKLEEACDFFGIPQPAKHRALDDARSVLEIMRHVRRRGLTLRVKNPWDKKDGPSYGVVQPSII